jgi:hypothetical protein
MLLDAARQDRQQHTMRFLRMPKIRTALWLAALLAASPLAQADDVSADKLAKAIGVADLQVKVVPKRRPQQIYQDYEINNAKGDTLFFVIQAPPSMFAEWKQVPDFAPISGLGQEAYERPGMDQFCARGARYAACVTLMPMAPFPAGKPSPQQIKAALATLL